MEQLRQQDVNVDEILLDLEKINCTAFDRFLQLRAGLNQLKERFKPEIMEKLKTQGVNVDEIELDFEKVNRTAFDQYLQLTASLNQQQERIMSEINLALVDPIPEKFHQDQDLDQNQDDQYYPLQSKNMEFLELKELLKQRTVNAKPQTQRIYFNLLKKYISSFPGIPTKESLDQFLKVIKYQDTGCLKLVIGFLTSIYKIEYKFQYQKPNVERGSKQKSMTDEERQNIIHNAHLRRDRKFINYFELLERTAFRISDLWDFTYNDIQSNWNIDIKSKKTGKVYCLKFSSEASRINSIRDEIGQEFYPEKSLFQQYYGFKCFKSFTIWFNEKIKEYSENNRLSSDSIRKRAINLLEKKKKGLGSEYTQSNLKIFTKFHDEHNQEKKKEYLPLINQLIKKRKQNHKRRFTLRRKR